MDCVDDIIWTTSHNIILSGSDVVTTHSPVVTCINSSGLASTIIGNEAGLSLDYVDIFHKILGNVSADEIAVFIEKGLSECSMESLIKLKTNVDIAISKKHYSE